jgi:NAD(P)-dependent dehydrogenase (short-subunit alcohol dehydrogenase family)
MKKILLLGGSGQIGKEIFNKIKDNYEVYCTSKRELCFGSNDDYYNLRKLIIEKKPDLIINCVGVFFKNETEFESVINVNYRPSWYVIKILKEFANNVKTNYSVIGSSAHKEGKKDYYLYSSSKSGLTNMIEGAQKFFDCSTISLNVINLPPVESLMNKKAKNPIVNRAAISLDQASEFILVNSVYNFTSGVIDYKSESSNQ